MESLRSTFGGLWASARFTGATLGGYALGVALVYGRVVRVERWSDAISSGAVGFDQLDPLYVRFGRLAEYLHVYRFPDGSVLRFDKWLETTATILIPTMLAVSFSQRIGLRAAPGRLTDAPKSSVPAIRDCWRLALRDASKGLGSGACLLVAVVAGFACGIAAEVYPVVRMAWETAGAGSFEPARPVIGVSTVSDLTWLLAWGVLIAPLMVLVAARSRLRRNRDFLIRWCATCGYPRAENEAPVCVVPCSECGNVPPAPKQAASRPLLLGRTAAWLVVASSLAMVHLLVPRVPEVVAVLRGISAEKHANTVILAKGTPVHVERQDGRMWFWVEPRVGAGPARLHVVSQHLDSTNTLRGVIDLIDDPNARATSDMIVAIADDTTVRVTATWQGSFGVAHLYLVPAGATSIRSVDASAVPAAK